MANSFTKIEISPQFDRIAFLREFDPRTSTYLVSDLHTKLDIQKILFERFDFLAEDAVLRASELWQRLLLRSRPDLQTVSVSLMQSILGEWLENQKVEWASGAGASQSLLTAIQQFLPIYMAENGVELFKEWLENNPTALMRMGQWFFLGLEAWNFLLAKKIITVSWIPAILSQLPELPRWPRNLVVDLESNLTGIESDLIKKLSFQAPVSLLTPPAEWRQQYFKVLWPYSVFLDEKLEKSAKVKADMSGCSSRRFTTRMTEGKDAVGQVRAWLDQGIDISKIAVLAPDIEEYWPLISSYFEIEGVPVNKSKVSPLHSFLDVGAWLARMRVESKAVDSADVELSVYRYSHRRLEMKFDDFRSLFKKIYDFDDLKRDEDLFELFNTTANDRSRFDRDAFITWSIQRWNLNDDSENLKSIIEKLMNETPASIEMTLRSWVRYAESIAAKNEKNVEPAGDGVAFMKTESGFYQKWSHVYFLGLTENAVKGNESTMLTLSDIVQIGQDLGFYLDYSDKPRIECITHWISGDPNRTSVLSFAATDFNGEPEAPSLFWLSHALAGNFDIEKYSEPHFTRWDELQLNVEQSASDLRKAVDEDLGRLAPTDLKLPQVPTLSASQIERFIECPFKFSADKILKLADPAEVDLDLDHRTRGNLLHALFENILQDPVRLDRTQNELSQLVEELRLKEKVVCGDPRLWPAYKARFVALGEKFQEFEKDWRKQFPQTKTVGREFAFEVGFKISTGKFCPKDQGDFNFRGRIDRIDEATSGPSKGELVLIDYKSSDNGLRNHGSWLSNSQLQLALYAMVIESGLTDLGEGRKVAGAFYYIAKTFKRNKGMQLEGAGVGLLPPPGPRSGSKIVPAKQSELFEKVGGVLRDVSEAIRAGRLHVKPDDIKECEKCRWRKLCRAPHLN